MLLDVTPQMAEFVVGLAPTLHSLHSSLLHFSPYSVMFVRTSLKRSRELGTNDISHSRIVNMALPLAVSAAGTSSCSTSQCSTTLPFSTRKNIDGVCRLLLRTEAVDSIEEAATIRDPFAIERTGLPDFWRIRIKEGSAKQSAILRYRYRHVLARKHYTRARCDSLR